jgi:hypothetical protein
LSAKKESDNPTAPVAQAEVVEAAPAEAAAE